MTDDLERRLADVTQRLERLEKTVGEFVIRLADSQVDASANVRPAPAPSGSRLPQVSPSQDASRQDKWSFEPTAAVATGAATALEFIEPPDLETSRARRLRRSAAQALPTDWEQIVGGQALGWAAVVVLLFATAFFVRYAFENGWLGPQGRVALGVFAGVALVVAGAHYHAKRWRAFSQMLTAGGVTLLYLATYSAYGFYHLLDSRAASVFLAVLVVQAALLALRYDAMAIALMAIIGGLLTPILMHTERDQYRQLFAYLLTLNAGVVALRTRRAWPALGTIAFLGAESLFWLWEFGNYHPEKRAWAICFQATLATLYVAHDWWTAGRRPALLTREDPCRLVLVAIVVFANCYELLHDDYDPWMGAMALAVALLFAVITHSLVDAQGKGQTICGASLALSAGFLALALPLQSRGPWNSLGWAVEAGVLAWLGLRVRRPLLRLMAAPLAVLAMGWILTDDRANPILVRGSLRAVHWAIFNRFTLTALAAICSLLVAIGCSRKLLERVSLEERSVFGACFVTALLLAGHFVSVDLYAWAAGDDDRFAQMLVSGWWSSYAAALLAAGFYARVAVVRWTALGIFGITIFKVFFFDMADLNELYRVGAFFTLAIVLGLGAWAYQRHSHNSKSLESAKG